MVITISVTLQAVASALFLLRYSMLIRWWKTVSGRMLAGMVICLFLITSTLAYTDTNEGLDGTPLLITIGRFGFGVVVIYGLIALECRYRRRRRDKLRAQPEEEEVDQDQ